MAQVSEKLGVSVDQFVAILDALGVFDDENDEATNPTGSVG